MSAGYFDASVVLALVQGEPTRTVAERLWEGHAVRVSSRLLAAECVSTLRRAVLGRSGAAVEAWSSAARAILDGLLEEIALYDVTGVTIERLRADERLAGRALDALHVATALSLRPHHDDPDAFTFCTFDRGQAAMARAAGLRVLDAP